MNASPHLESVEWGESLVGPAPMSAELIDSLQRLSGVPGDKYAVLAHAPWVARAIAGFSSPLSQIPPELADLITLVVSQDNSCRFCYGTQRIYLQIQGYTDERIDRTARLLDANELSERDRLILDFVRKLSRAHPRPAPGERERLFAAGVSDAELREIVAHAGGVVFANCLATLIAAPLAPPTIASLPKQVVDFMRGLLGRRKRGAAVTPLPPEGPGGALFEALGSSPLSRVWHGIFQDGLMSPILPLKTKAFMLAVVARAVGCTTCEALACDLLTEEGWQGSDVSSMIANLSSQRLDAREAVLIPFARETVRYDASVIQKKLRAIATSLMLTPAEITEVAGILAAANAGGRMTVLLEWR